MDKFNEIIRLISPYISFVGILLIAYYKLNSKIINDKIENEIKEREKRHTELCDKLKLKLNDLKNTFNAAMKNERRFSHEIQQRHSEMIDELFKVKQTKEVCREKHNK